MQPINACHRNHNRWFLNAVFEVWQQIGSPGHKAGIRDSGQCDEIGELVWPLELE
jgi:hypothetical protein